MLFFQWWGIFPLSSQLRLSRSSTAALALASQTMPLKEHDPELYALIAAEKERQRSGLELIASVRQKQPPCSRARAGPLHLAAALAPH